jgi:hypothetical protein
MANYGDWTTFSWNAPSVFYRNRASAQNNIPHMFQLGYVYDVPFGNGRKWATSGVSKAILGNWQLNGFFSAYQGRQYMLSASGAALNMPGNAQTPTRSNRRLTRWARLAMTARGSTPFARYWRPIRQCWPQHDARTRCSEYRLKSVPYFQADGAAAGTVPG